jgi:hypothetical protein
MIFGVHRRQIYNSQREKPLSLLTMKSGIRFLGKLLGRRGGRSKRGDVAAAPAELAWVELGGTEFEPWLTDQADGTPIRLVDAKYLIELAQSGGALLRRQDLPESAFITLEDLRRMSKGGQFHDCLRIFCVSHPWLQPDHCDPKGDNLRLLARVLKAYVECSGGTYAVFIE